MSGSEGSNSKVKKKGRRKAEPLSALAIKNLSQPGYHFVGEVDGLILQVKESGAKSWILRARTPDKRRPEIGLGGFPDVTLAMAKEKARQLKDVIAQGIDPVQQKAAARSAMAAKRAKQKTVRDAALEYIGIHEKEWSKKSYNQWKSSFELHVFGTKLADMLMEDVQTIHVVDVLKPIWETKTVTATRVRSRLEQVFDWAIANGVRENQGNPALWRNRISTSVPKPQKIHKVKHFASVPYKEAGEFMQRLRQMDGMGAKALEFAILTVGRSTQTRGATWSEIDLKAKLWFPDTGRMKAKRLHRVPLSKAAIELLQSLPRVDGSELIFPGQRAGRMMSDATMNAAIDRMGVEATQHGFRSTFRTWTEEVKNYQDGVIRAAMAHAIGDKVDEAYQRGELLEKRRRVMEDWALFLSKPYAQHKPAEVLPFKARA